MIPPLSTNTAPLLPDPASTPAKGDVTLSSITQSAPQTDKQTTSKPASAKDTVALSNTALTMSKALNSQSSQASPQQAGEVQQQQEPVKGQGTPYEAPTKSFPPYMGDANELKNLKITSPALYREILRMIVPPPLDISYADAQMLQSGKEFTTRS